MRIVGGQWQGRLLQTPADRHIRPTSDKVRGALFNILDHRYGAPYKDVAVLDLFCGTGALGLEALSRGAAHATFIDNNPAALALTRDNIQSLGAAAQSTVLRADAGRWLSPTRFSVIFADPPYAHAVDAFLDTIPLSQGGLLILEQGKSRPFWPDAWQCLDTRRYGTTWLLFLTTAKQPFNIF